MSHPFFSVIIPAYNCELFLRSCLDSVIKQTFADFEVLLFDDGSQDQTPKICDEYAKRDSRFLVVHQLNRGQFLTRYDGIEKSKGQYLLFLDSDDCWEPNLLERVHSIISEYKCDLVVFEAYQITTQGQKIIPTHWPKLFDEDLLFQNQDMRFTTKFLAGGLDWVWSKAFKKDILSIPQDKSPTIRLDMTEDRLFCIRPIFLANRVFYTQERLYDYRNNPGSAIHNFKAKYLDDVNAVETLAFEFLENYEGCNQGMLDTFIFEYMVRLYTFITTYLVKTKNVSRSEVKAVLNKTWENAFYQKARFWENPYHFLGSRQQAFMRLFEKKRYGLMIAQVPLWKFIQFIRHAK